MAKASKSVFTWATTPDRRAPNKIAHVLTSAGFPEHSGSVAFMVEHEWNAHLWRGDTLLHRVRASNEQGCIEQFEAELRKRSVELFGLGKIAFERPGA